jgi:non-specific serine/threonine protein kinase/serine/threonine-protein kinase
VNLHGDARVLSASQHASADALFDTLLDLPEAQRLSNLVRMALDDPAVEREVQSLLLAAAACGAFLDRPAQPTPRPPENAALEVGLRIGPWRIVRAIGNGGMGEVYEAERIDGGFAQRAAVKLLRREASAHLDRFHAERQILARLDHAGIASLHDGGVAPDGRPWMAMELVEGRTLTAFCNETHATLDARLQLFRQVCDAVAYAHHHLVVHRDLKPANIFVNGDEQVKLLDFGVAKLLDDAGDDERTRTLGAPLTPLYAAPEQLTDGSITTATDVYALGVVLFELLTGETPWTEVGLTHAAQVLRAVNARTARSASAAAAASGNGPVAPHLLRGDLDAIVAKALRADPAHRYATVDALRRDIENARRGDAVAAREGAQLYALGRILWRFRWTAATTVAVFLALSIGLGLAAWQAHRAATERDAALRDAAREEALRYHITGLFRSAIADHGSEAPTAKTMLDKSAQRVLLEYRDDPQLSGQVVLALADLYNALEDVQGSAALLDGFLAASASNADAAAVADARQKLAGIELMRGHVDRSGNLLDQAEAYWMHDPKPHTEERLEGMGVRARWQRARGDLVAAIATDRATIVQRIALSGHDHRETATLYNSLAISLAAANRLDEALAAYKETSAIYDKLGLGDGLDAQIIRGNTGTLALRIGRLNEAESLLKAAFEQERALAGDSAAVAASMGYYGKLLAITDRRAEAIATLSSAVAIGTRYTGATSPLTIQNRLFLGEAQLAAGSRADARATLEADRRDALAQYGDKHALSLRAELALAQLDNADGQRDRAKARLRTVIATLRAIGAPGQGTLAQALVAMGELELSAGATVPAITALQEASLLLLAVGGSERSWELARTRERLGEALAAGGAMAEARHMLQGVEATLQAQLGAGHPETLRVRRALGRIAA